MKVSVDMSGTMHYTHHAAARCKDTTSPVDLATQVYEEIKGIDTIPPISEPNPGTPAFRVLSCEIS
jgi:hypothetical protein